MKRKPKPSRGKAFDALPFLEEIERVLPSIVAPTLLKAVRDARWYLVGYIAFHPPGSSDDAVSSQTRRELARIVESLRCCGIAPAGWPAPPKEGALIRVSTLIKGAV